MAILCCVAKSSLRGTRLILYSHCCENGLSENLSFFAGTQLKIWDKINFFKVTVQPLMA
jgi:hypothetical protein